MKRSVIVAVIATTVLLAIAGFALAANLGPGGPPASDLPGQVPGRPPGGSDRVTVRAPIDAVDILIRESSPPQVTAQIGAGLPNGCARQHSHDVVRSGNTITVTVLNSMPPGQPMCTMVYGSYVLTIDLGTDFAPGETYTLRVNDQVQTFRT